MPAIQVTSLTKSFRSYRKAPGFVGSLKSLIRREPVDTVAVDQVSFTVEPGEFVGFLGPNGAGKTTTLKMLAGLLHPSSGTASVFGFTPWERKEDYRRQFSLLLGQKNQLWWDLPAQDSFELNARIYDLNLSKASKIIQELSELLGVREKLSVMVRELSLGERMKMELIASLLHEPRLLFLDEPTIGLDVISQKSVRDFLKEHNSLKKTTILLTSHYMDDIRQLCPRVIIIDRGRIFFDGPLAGILDRFSVHKVITLHFVSAAAGAARPVQLFSQLGEVLKNEPETLQLKVPRDKAMEACKQLLDLPGVQDVDIQEVPIEDVIREVFQRNRDVR